MQLIYVNPTTKQIVDVDGNVVNENLTVYFGTKSQYSFQFLDYDLEDGDYYLAANNNLDDYNSCCFLCKEYSIENNIITFNVDTFNKSFQNKIRQKDTILFLELGFKKINADSYVPLLSSTISAQPRVFVAGNEPPPIKLYYTKEEVDDLLLKSTINYNQTNIISTQNLKAPFVIDFEGKAIKIYSSTEAVSGTLTFQSVYFINNDTSLVPTVEIHIPASGGISTITIPNNIEVIDIPDTLLFDENYNITYHVFTARFILGSYQLNYCYSYGIGMEE